MRWLWFRSRRAALWLAAQRAAAIIAIAAAMSYAALAGFAIPVLNARFAPAMPVAGAIGCSDSGSVGRHGSLFLAFVYCCGGDFIGYGGSPTLAIWKMDGLVVALGQDAVAGGDWPGTTDLVGEHVTIIVGAELASG